MKRLFVFLLCFSAYFVNAQDILWKVTDTAELLDGNYKFVGHVEKGVIVKGRHTQVSLKDGEMLCDYAARVYIENKKYSIDAEKVIPLNVKDLIDERLLTPAVHRRNREYVTALSIPLLKAKDRSLALKLIPKSIEYEESDGSEWYVRGNYESHLDLFQTIINPCELKGSSTFYIVQTERWNNAYNLEVINDQWWLLDNIIPKNIQPEIIEENSGYRTHLLLVPDGEYLDVFYEGKYLLGSYIEVDKDYVSQYASLINRNICDLSKITWPKRANKAHRLGRSCIVVESLRLRSQESTVSQTLMTMQPGTAVKITALGKQQTIDGITANWVKVKLDDGTEGWCFGGYLVDITR